MDAAIQMAWPFAWSTALSRSFTLVHDRFTYDDEGIITSNVMDDKSKPIRGQSGVLKTVNDRGEIESTVYRLSHHGAWPNANKPFFL